MVPKRGYTLIEILIVMVIISIVGSMALLTISRNQSSRLQNFSKELTNLMLLAEEQAMLRPAVLGLEVKQNSYQFFQYQDQWKPLNDKTLIERPFPSNAQIRLEIQGKTTNPIENDDAPKPQIIFSSNGDVTPFVISVGKKNAAPLYTIKGSLDGNIQFGEAHED